ncbi:MAG: hypothetical protein V1752_05200 [Candidatus Firestonebacteria bacterium]
MKKILFAVLFSLYFLIPQLGAEDFTFDTRIGYYFTTNGMLFRDTHLGYDLKTLMPNLSIRGQYYVLDGVALTGSANNYKLGLQAVYSLKLDDNLSIAPFCGGALNNSTVQTNTISVDGGFELNYKLFSPVTAIIGADASFFSDSTMIDYYAGGSVPILNWLSFEAFYCGLLNMTTSVVHNAGAGSRLTATF